LANASPTPPEATAVRNERLLFISVSYVHAAYLSS
jgi:hypothetical protein